MDSLKDIIGYFCREYPHKAELSKARLTKMVYLADWKNCLESHRPITDIEWVFNHYGPYVDEVSQLAEMDEDFDVLIGTTLYGAKKHLIQAHENFEPEVSDGVKSVLDNVIETTKTLYWSDFISFVYSTYPIRTQPRYMPLDLPALARAYTKNEAA